MERKDEDMGFTETVLAGLIVGLPTVILTWRSAIRLKKRDQLQSAESLLSTAHSRLSDAITRLHKEPIEPHSREVRRCREAYLNQFDQVCAMIVADKNLHREAVGRHVQQVTEWISEYPEYFTRGTPFPALLEMVPCAISLGIDPHKNPYIIALRREA